MEATILNSSFERIGVIDVFESFIWTERYDTYGDFEIFKKPDSNEGKILVDAAYLILKESEYGMILEDTIIKTDIENGTKLIIKGRSFESILDRRIIWEPTVLSGNFQTNIETLLNENAINPTNLNRKISLLEFEATDDPKITSLEFEEQFWGENLYEVISGLCKAAGVGFKISLTTNNKLRFKLYSGADRSYDQTTNPYVVFSPEFENLINSDYQASSRALKTATLVAGEKGIGNARVSIEVDPYGESATDLFRRETFTDAQNILRNTPEGVYSEEDYLILLEQRGLEELTKKVFIKTFEGQAETSRTFVYGKDFFMGDILQVANEYGQEAKTRVVELIRSQDASGIKIFPTFSLL